MMEYKYKKIEGQSIVSIHNDAMCNVHYMYMYVQDNTVAVHCTTILYLTNNKEAQVVYYLSNTPQVSMVYRLINHAGCW